MAFVELQNKGHVAIVTINRPKALNALNTEVLQEIEEVFNVIDIQETRCVILTGAGDKSFVAGAYIP